MRISRLYFQEPLSEGTTITLGREKTHYIKNVLRLRPGTRLSVFDGSGAEYPAELIEISRNECSLSIGAATFPATESPIKIELIQGLARPEHMDIAIRKTAELGVTAIRPLLASRSQGTTDQAKLAKRWDHWKNIAISASEQCGRTKVAYIHAACDLTALLEDIGEKPESKECRLLLNASAASFNWSPAPLTGGIIRVAVGPEGGFTNDETTRLEACGFTDLGLGPRVLRTETASIAALTLIQHYWGDANSTGRTTKTE